jgi:hypothetical protein
MLAVTLSAFLLGLITSAIYLNVRVLQRQQREIERSQIARNVLFSITGDLRAAIQYKPADVTGLDALTVSQATIAAAAAGMEGIDPGIAEAAGNANPGGSTTAGGSGTTGAGGSGGTEESTPDASQNIGSNQTEILRPGLYGNATEIMLDISRLPRVDQYDPLVTGVDQPSVELPTDVKTVAWFVSDQSEESVHMQVGRDTAASGGLYRRQLERAVAAYSNNLAATLAAAGNTKLIASEVIGIQFRYFDGQDWVNEWDSDENGGFPTAVEVTILVDNERVISEDITNRLRENPESGELYRAVINLPVAEIPEEDETAAGGGA